MPEETTWKPYTESGKLSYVEKESLPESVFAFPEKRKESLTDANHVRDALARFDQVQGVTEEEKDLAFRNIKKAAEYYGLNLRETDWHQLGNRR